MREIKSLWYVEEGKSYLFKYNDDVVKNGPLSGTDFVFMVNKCEIERELFSSRKKVTFTILMNNYTGNGAHKVGDIHTDIYSSKKQSFYITETGQLYEL